MLNINQPNKIPELLNDNSETPTFSGELSKPSSEFGSAVSSFFFFIFKGLIKEVVLVKCQQDLNPTSLC